MDNSQLDLFSFENLREDKPSIKQKKKKAKKDGPTRAEISRVIKRYVYKENLDTNSSQEIIFFYLLLKEYPDMKFWWNWDLGFMVKSLIWFRSADGKYTLERGYKLFHFEFDKPSNGADNIMADEKVGEDYIPTSKNNTKKSVSAFLK